MKTRDELQHEALLALVNNKRVIVAWGTGVGKSRVAVKAVEAMVSCGKSNILLLVGQTVHKLNWHNEFIDAKGTEEGERLWKNITVECYDSLCKYEGRHFDFIIADEAHHLRSDNRTELITSLTTEYFLCLTATMSDNNDAQGLLASLEDTFGKFVTMNFGIQDAIDNGILSEPKIYVHVLPLDKLGTVHTINISWGKPWLKEYRKQVDCDVEKFREIYEKRYERGFDNMSCDITCRTKEGYELLSSLIESVGEEIKEKNDFVFSQTRRLNDYRLPLRFEEAVNVRSEVAKARKDIEMLEIQRKLLGAKRKVLLGKAKTPYSMWLLNKLANKKYICFCANVEQCKELGGENIIHAQKKDNGKVIESFNAGDISSLFAVDMIKEGQNLRGIQAGVIIQLGGKERDFIQQFGRTMRSNVPEQHIVVINNTRDVIFYKNAVKTINPQYIKILRYGCRPAEKGA